MYDSIKGFDPVINVTRNFTWEECMCKDGTECPEDLKPYALKIAKKVEIIRHFAGDRPVIVDSWYRTKKHNDELYLEIRKKDPTAGVHSRHLLADAMDIRINGIPPVTLHSIIENLIFQNLISDGGLGLYKSFVHVDNRGYKARWNG